VSLVTQAFVFERYGPRLDLEQLAKVLGVAKSTLYNQISAATCPVPTYVDLGKRFADYRAVAQHLDDCAARAA
jgi:predicted DNA-binding transcriptional regulator AlpA